MIRCFTREQTSLYERGYPHLVVLVDGHKDDAKADPSKIYAKQYDGAYHVQWPRKVAEAFVRACTSAASDARTTAKPGPIDVEQARAAIAYQLAKPRRWAAFADPHLLFCIEAFLGTDETLELLVDALSSLPPERWPVKGASLDPGTRDATMPGMNPAIHYMNVLYENGKVGYFAYLTGYLLLRASDGVRERARARLEDLWKKSTELGVDPIEETLHGGLDLALHGAEGARRVLPRSHWQYLWWWGFIDDPTLFRTRFAEKMKSDWSADPRHVFLCPDIIDTVLEKKVVKRIAKRASFLEDVGMFDHPRVPELMREWKDDKKAGAVATRWLAEH